jgi:hypothetical protein
MPAIVNTKSWPRLCAFYVLISDTPVYVGLRRSCEPFGEIDETYCSIALFRGRIVLKRRKAQALGTQALALNLALRSLIDC